jgi:hypothetical protein
MPLSSWYKNARRRFSEGSQPVHLWELDKCWMECSFSSWEDTSVRLLNTFLRIYKNGCFFIVFTRSHHLSLWWATKIPLFTYKFHVNIFFPAMGRLSKLLFLQMFLFQTKPYTQFSSAVCVPLTPPILCSVMLFSANYLQELLVYSPADSPDNVKGSSNTDVSIEVLQRSKRVYLQTL